MDLFNLVAMLTLDKSKFEQGLSEAQENASGFGGKIATAAKVGVGAMTAVTAATVAAGTAIVKSTGAVASYGDDIDKMSQKMGMSAEKYQEWDAILQHSGSSMESMKASMKTLANAAETGSDAFEKLGISQEDIANMSQEELFEATIAGLQNVSDTTERTYLAGKLLGRGATELGALLNTSAEDTEAMRQRVHELGGVMSDDAVKAAASYQDSLQDMNTAIDGVKRGIMSEFLPSLTSAMDGIGNLFSGDSETGLGQIKEGVSAFISKLSEIIPRVIEIGGQILGALSQAIIENLPALLDAGIQSISTLAQGIAKALPELIPAIVDAVLTMVETLLDNIDLIIDAALQLMIGLAQGLINAIPKIIEKIPVIIEKIVSALVGAIPQIASAGVRLFVALVTNLPQIIMSIVAAVPQIISGIVKAFGQGFEKMKEVGKKLFTSLGNALGSGVGAIKEKAGNLMTSIRNAFSNAGETMKNIGSKITTGLHNGISGAASKVSQIAGKVFTSIKNVFTKAPEALANIGRNLMVGLYNGIVEKAKAVIEKVKGIASDIIGWAKNILGISSPSKEFKKIGGFMMQGMATGIEDGLRSVDNAMSDMEDVIYKRKPSINIVKNASATGGYGESGQYFTVPRQQQAKQLTVILELDRMQLGKAVYTLNNEETQRVGVRLAGGYA